jgi:hypothetical protein
MSRSKAREQLRLLLLEVSQLGVGSHTLLQERGAFLAQVEGATCVAQVVVALFRRAQVGF